LYLRVWKYSSWCNGTTGKKVVHLLMESPDFNPIAMVRKEAQQAYFKDKKY
jgi:hypothetical protein